jgi:uncharacterized ubiquitin-like protein YukD
MAETEVKTASPNGAAETEVKTESPNSVLNVDVEMPGGVLLKDTAIPLNFKTEQAIAGLVSHMQLPFVDEATAKRIQYSLMNVTGNFTLREGEFFRDAKVKNGDRLKLFTTKQVAPPPGVNALPFAPGEQEKEVNVYLAVLDFLKIDYRALPLDVPVSELIRQIINDYKVPEKDRFGDRGRFKLSSKGAARVLLHGETLRQAGIMHEDRLTLQKDETPGARP